MEINLISQILPAYQKTMLHYAGQSAHTSVLH